MPAKVSRTLRALLEIRDEQRRSRAGHERLRGEVVQMRDEVTHELRGVSAVLVDVRDLLRERLDLRDQVGDHERRLTALEKRAG